MTARPANPNRPIARTRRARTRLAALFGLVVATMVLSAAPALAQCPMCKAAVVSEDGATGGVAQGYNVTTLLMFSSPFLLLGIVVGAIYLSVRSARAREAAKASVGTQAA